MRINVLSKEFFCRFSTDIPFGAHNSVGIVPYNGDLYLFKSGSIGIGFTFIARAFGDKNKFGIFKKIKDTEEAKLDSIFVTPICFVFGILIFSLVFLF